MENFTIGIIGNGFVGKATQIFARSSRVTKVVYDIDPNKCEPPGLTLEQCVKQCNLIFICVPTPVNVQTGKCDTSIVEKVVKNIKDLKYTGGIIVRSTVPPGTCASLQVCHMPEYLTEKNWEKDFINTTSWELGVDGLSDHAKVCIDVLTSILFWCECDNVIVSSKLIVTGCFVTETAKYMRNAMLAVKIGVCNEFEAYCRAKGIEYEAVRQLVIGDPRIGSSHTMVPGHDGQRGFGGTCLPKDLRSISTEMMLTGVQPMILQATIARNELIDRPAKDWMSDIGRSVSYSKKI